MKKETLVLWRERFDLTKCEAAIIMGVCRITYARWELGTAKIPNSVPLACAAFALNLKGYGE